MEWMVAKDGAEDTRVWRQNGKAWSTFHLDKKTKMCYSYRIETQINTRTGPTNDDKESVHSRVTI